MPQLCHARVSRLLCCHLARMNVAAHSVAALYSGSSQYADLGRRESRHNSDWSHRGQSTRRASGACRRHNDLQFVRCLLRSQSALASTPVPRVKRIMAKQSIIAQASTHHNRCPGTGARAALGQSWSNAGPGSMHPAESASDHSHSSRMVHRQ